MWWCALVTLSATARYAQHASRRDAVHLAYKAAAATTALALHPPPIRAITHDQDTKGTTNPLLQDGFCFRVAADSTAALNPTVAETTRAELIRALRTKKAIFLGEHHNSANDHLLQASLITTLARDRPCAVGLEAVQRRFQPTLDAFIGGSISEAELEEQTEWKSRWFWPFERYLPVFRACRALGVKLVAMNVDREDLGQVETGGLPALPVAALQRYVPDAQGFGDFAATNAFREYVAYVVAPSYAMHKRMGILRNTISGQVLEEDMTFRNFLSGRLLWDEAMGSSAAAWSREHPDGLFIGLVGSDHVKFGCGVPARCARQIDGGLDAVASLMLNPMPTDTLADPTLGGEARTRMGGVQPVTFADYVLQLRFAQVSGDGGPSVVGAKAEDRTMAARQAQARRGSAVLPLADYLLFSESVAKPKVM